MSRCLFAFLFVAAFSTAAGAQTSVSKDTTRAPSGAYKLETAHSLVIFSIGHLGLTDYYGRFDKLAGTLNFDSNQPEKSATSITIDTTSVDTPSDRLNTELKSDNVFATGKFPNATFKSTSITKTGPDTRRTLSVVWGTNALPGRSSATENWYRSCLQNVGAKTHEVSA